MKSIFRGDSGAIKVSVVVATVLAALAATIGVGTVANATKPDTVQHVPVTICHATGAEGHWVMQTVDDDSILNDQHEPVGNGHAVHQDGRDIIPPFTTTDGFEFPGQGDQSILANDCVVPSEPEMVEVCDPDTMMVIEVPLGTEGDYKPVEFCDEDPVKPVLSIDAQCVDPNVETAIGFKLDIANADPNTTYVGVTIKTADYTGPWASGLFPVVADAISYPFVFAVGDEITVQAYANEDLTQRIGEPVTHTVEACDVEKPELPDPKVTVTGTSQCVVPLNGKAMMVTTTTTTPYKWDGDVAVLDEANAEEVITTTEVDDEGCVPPPPNEVKVCDVDTGELINVPEGTEGDYAPVTDEACNPTTPEEPKTPEVPKTPDTPTRTVKTD